MKVTVRGVRQQAVSQRAWEAWQGGTPARLGIGWVTADTAQIEQRCASGGVGQVGCWVFGGGGEGGCEVVEWREWAWCVRRGRRLVTLGGHRCWCALGGGLGWVGEGLSGRWYHW